MTANDGTVQKRGHLPVHAVVPVRERPAVYPRANVFLDEGDHVGSKGRVSHRSCRPELPICSKKPVSEPRRGVLVTTRY